MKRPLKGQVVIVTTTLFFSSCVPIWIHKRELREIQIETFQKARKIAYYDHCDAAVKDINSKLRALGEQK